MPWFIPKTAPHGASRRAAQRKGGNAWNRKIRHRSLKAASPKQDPTLEKRLAALEEENSSLKAAKARNALIDSVATATGVDRALVASLNGEDEEALTAQAEAIAAIAKPRGGAPAVPEAGGKDKPGKPSKREILAIEDKKERLAAIAANIDLFK